MAISGWSELPQHLLSLIEQCLVTYTDKVRFSCVCTSWRSILPTISSKEIQPWLLVPRESTSEKYEGFLSLHHEYNHYLEVPEVLDKMFRGSSHGWLVCIEDSPKISLFNPITRVEIALPPRNKFPDVRKYCAKKVDSEYALENYACRRFRETESYFIEASHVHRCFLKKVVLSSNPASGKGNFMAVAIYGSHCNLAYCKLGDTRWTCIAKGRMGYEDAIFHEGKLYAVTQRWQVEVFDLSGLSKKVDAIEPPPEEENRCRCYFVGTSMGLLFVLRRLQDIGRDENWHYATSYFIIYRYEPSSRSWCKVENIGENVLFLGLNASISIPSSHLPAGGCYKGNRIYFTDNILDFHKFGVRGGHDIGFYDLDSRRKTVVRLTDNDRYWQWHWPTPIWYMHSPQDFIKD